MKKNDRIVIVGAGGHGKVVADTILLLNRFEELCFIDEAIYLRGQNIFNIQIIGGLENIRQQTDRVHVAIGSNSIRSKMLALLQSHNLYSVVHPRASISSRSCYGAGSFIAAMAVIGPNATLGAGVIVNHGAIVDHDCEVGDYSHIAPCASLGGGVSIGSNVLIGAGARILPGIRIGAGSIIGAGAVVTKDMASGITAIGVPANSIENSHFKEFA